jgi:hypothetical protein
MNRDDPRIEQAEKYIRRIRNPAKRFYGWQVLACKVNDAPLPPDPKGLSYMGAQAVRNALRELLV